MNQTTKTVTQELARRGMALDEHTLDRKVTTTRYAGEFVIADVMEQGAGDGAVVIWAWLRPYDKAYDTRAPMRCVPLGTVERVVGKAEVA